jgi:hypothetical protein
MDMKRVQDFFERQFAFEDLAEKDLNKFVIRRLLGSSVELVNQQSVVKRMNVFSQVPHVDHLLTKIDSLQVDSFRMLED